MKMASISHDANGTRRVQFTDRNGERKTVRLGVISAKNAESFRLKLQNLVAARFTETAIDAETARWLADLPDRMYSRLVSVGLAEPRASSQQVTLGMLLDRFEKSASVKASTRAAYKQATGSLRDHLKAETPLKAITPADADEWRKTLAESALAPATVAKRVNIAKSVFRKAVKWGLMASNPFADLRAGSQSNPERSFYVPVDSIRAILDECPDDQWRVIIALSRFAGLRCPSEVVLIRWGDINWERGRLTVRSPKTEGHDGHAVRLVPITPELRPILLALFERAEPGAEAVVPRLRDPKTNLRTTLYKIIERAGLTPWPRLFHNMRASCATDWVERFPAHVVAGWLGHSPMIAAKHYLQTRDAHFDLATGGANCGAPEARNAAQHPSAQDGVRSSDDANEPCFAGVLQTDANPSERAQTEGMGAGGFEPPKALAIRFTV